MGSVVYAIIIPDRRKQQQLCHINMLKEYHERNCDGEKTCAVVVTSVPNVICEKHEAMEGDKMESDYLYSTRMTLNNSELLINLRSKLNRLSRNEAAALKCLILKYTQLFPDTPTQTNVMYHDVDVGDVKPAYRVNPQKRELLQQEVKYMLYTGLIEPSHIAWSSPCLLVPKPDGSVTFCIDFRKVNALIKPDSFPLPRIEDGTDQVGHSKYVCQ